MKFGYYIPQDTSYNIRCIDGVFALVDVRLPSNYTRDGYWKAMLNAKVVSSNQAVLREKVKRCRYATYCRSVAKTLHGVPDEVELYAPGENGESGPSGFDMQIIFWRHEAGLSQAALAEKTGIPKRTIENWESDKNTPPEWTQRLVLKELASLAKREGNQ